MSNEVLERRSLTPDTLRLPTSEGEKPVLLARKCTACGQYTFPYYHCPAQRLICPYCYAPTEEASLSSTGKVWSYTTLGRVYPDCPLKPPVVEAAVEMPEGVTVVTALVDCAPEDVHIGMVVEIDIMPHKRHEGYESVAFVFKPVKVSGNRG